MGPYFPCFLQLLSNSLCVVVVLREQATKIFEYLDAFQHVPVDQELAV
jgi:hypothetical protein